MVPKVDWVYSTANAMGGKVRNLYWEVIIKFQEPHRRVYRRKLKYQDHWRIRGIKRAAHKHPEWYFGKWG